jgi:exodeoxyribonuclease VII small subunit
MHASNEYSTMGEDAPKTFEQKLDRIEKIVSELQAGVALEKAVALFKEAKGLQRECETELNTAQDALKAMADDKS